MNKKHTSQGLTKMDTIIFIDWDDTLFPTHWLKKNDLDLNDHSTIINLLPYFCDLDESILNVINKFKKCGTVIIVTNASIYWIESSLRLLPKTNFILSDVKKVSARHKYSSTYKNIYEWKKKVFEDELLELKNLKKYKNIISIGDADYEYYALINLQKRIDCFNTNNTLKSIKLLRNPDYPILLDQLQVLSKNATKICSCRTHMDLKFSNKK